MLYIYLCFPRDLAVKDPPVNAGDRYLGQEDPLEKEMATQSSILAWRIPWTEEYGSLQFMDRTEQLTLSVKTKVTEMTLRKPGWKGTQS